MKLYQDKEKLKALYEKHGSAVRVAEEIGANHKTISIWMKKLGIEGKGSQGARKVSFNHEYFNSIDTEEKAYWLGFIMADGCVYVGARGNSYRLQINLKSADVAHLEKFQKAIGSSYKIQIKKIGKAEAALLKVNSTQMCLDLIKLGVVPRKSLICRFPELDKSFQSHFIRGYFDGDGSIDLHKKRDVRCRIFGGAEMLTDIQGILGQSGIETSFYIINKSKEYASLETKVGSDSSKFAEWMYGKSTIYLDRKFQRYCMYLSNVPFRSNPVDKIQVNCGDSLIASTTNHPQE